MTVRAPSRGRLVGMKEREYPRGKVDETIIGGPFVRYVPDPETIFMVVEKVGEEEFVRAFHPRVIWDKWGGFTVSAFRRCGCDGTQEYWAERSEEEVVVTDAMTVYQVPQEAWMSHWKERDEALQAKPIPPSPLP